MNSFPFLAAFTVCASFAILRATFDDLREVPQAQGLGAEHAAAAQRLLASVAPSPLPAKTVSIREANEGLLDHELAGADPIQAWLDRMLTPPADYFPPAE